MTVTALPQFLVIGVQRAGTTWLHQYLSGVPGISLPEGVKETFYFDRHYARGVEWYQSHFSRGNRKAGEVASTYLHSAEAPARVREALGAIPLACMLRDPAERAFSLYLHERRKGRVTGSFWEAHDQQPDLVETGYYAAHLRRWLETFDAADVRVFFLEDVQNDPDGFVRDFCSFIQVAPAAVPAQLRTRVNQGSVPASHALASAGRIVADVLRDVGLHPLITAARRAGLKRVFFGKEGADLPVQGEEDRRRLVDLYLRDIEALEHLTGRSLVSWKQA